MRAALPLRKAVPKCQASPELCVVALLLVQHPSSFSEQFTVLSWEEVGVERGTALLCGLWRLQAADYEA